MSGGLRQEAPEALVRLLADNSTEGEKPTHHWEDDAYWLTDSTLKIAARVCGAVLILILVGAYCAWRKFGQLIQDNVRKPIKDDGDELPRTGGNGAGRACQKLKRCLYHYCCCGYCCPTQQEALFRTVGFDNLKPRVTQTLRITLIGITNLNQRADIYFEVWTEPVECTYPKNSRIHLQAIGNVDLGGEVLEMDWFDDEDCVVINAVKYSGDKVSTDESMASISIPANSVQKYAQEARESGGNDKAGCRLVKLTKNLKHDKERRRRFGGGGEPSPLMPFIIMNLSPEMDEENKLLRRQIEELRDENKELEQKSGRYAKSRSKTKSLEEAEHAKAVMHAIVRFEIVQPSRFQVDSNAEQMYRSPSWQLPDDDLVQEGPGCAGSYCLS